MNNPPRKLYDEIGVELARAVSVSLAFCLAIPLGSAGSSGLCRRWDQDSDGSER